MPGIRDEFAQAFSQGQAGGTEAANQALAQHAALKQLLLGKQEDLKNKLAEQAGESTQKASQLESATRGLARMHGVDDTQPDWQAQLGKKLQGTGESVKVGDGGFSTGADPYARSRVAGVQQGKEFDKQALSAYKPINEQLNASKSTLDALNQGNATSDKLALINEARLAAGQGGSRAISHMVDVLSGGATANSQFQDKINWLQNTPNVPAMQPAQRDAIRESVFGRLPQLEQLHQQTAAQLGARGAAAYPMANTDAVVGAYTKPVEANLGQLKQMQAEYQKGRKGQTPVSSPSTSNANPTNLQSFMQKLGLGGGQQAAPQQAPAQGAGPMSFDDWKKAKAAGTLGQ